MKQLLISAIVLLSFSTLFAQQDGFRKARWGASFTDIKLSESSPLVTNVKQETLIYKDVLSGDVCDVYYMFDENGGLKSGLYHFTQEFKNAQQYVAQYEKFQSMLADKYGDDVDEIQTWHPAYRGINRSAFGKEIAKGNLSLSTEWNTPTGTVKISLTRGSDQQPQIQIYYRGTIAGQAASAGDKRSAMAKL